MIIDSQRTIYGLELQSSILSGVPHTVSPNTTLNEKLKHLIAEPVGVDTNYSIKYYAIGKGGTSQAPGTGGYPLSEHSVLDAALFDQIPFVVVPATNDIPATRHGDYRFRILADINGVPHYHYYLKAIKPSDIHTNTFVINNTAAGSARISIIPTSNASRLNPVPGGNAYTYNSSRYITRSIKLNFTLTPSEMKEITDAQALLNPGAAFQITEIGICGGLDKVVSGVTEAINVQIYFHVGVGISTVLQYDPLLGYVRAIELGGSEIIYANNI